MRTSLLVRRAALPLAVFVAVMAIHFVWTGTTTGPSPLQDGWITVPDAQPTWWERYVRSGGYWTGYTYALSLAFAAVAFRTYRERRFCSTGTAIVGGVTLSGFMAVAGCFLVGCCGSPMLGVYLSLFGAGFLPFAKPLVSGITTLMIGFFYWWMRRRARRQVEGAAVGGACADTACACMPSASVEQSAPANAAQVTPASKTGPCC